MTHKLVSLANPLGETYLLEMIFVSVSCPDNNEFNPCPNLNSIFISMHSFSHTIIRTVSKDVV